MIARILAGSAGWYVVEPDLRGGVTLYGPTLSVALAYEVAEECEARRKAMCLYAADVLMDSYRESLRQSAELDAAFDRAAEEWLR